MRRTIPDISATPPQPQLYATERRRPNARARARDGGHVPPMQAPVAGCRRPPSPPPPTPPPSPPPKLVDNTLTFTYVWGMTSSRWQALMHALHGNGPTTTLARNPARVKFLLPETDPFRTSMVNAEDVALDSGSFYHVVPDEKMLLNHQYLNQGFFTADGGLSKAVWYARARYPCLSRMRTANVPSSCSMTG